MDNPIQTTELTSADGDLDSIPLPDRPGGYLKVLGCIYKMYVTENIHRSDATSSQTNLKSLKQTILLAGETENYIPCEVRDYAYRLCRHTSIGAGWFIYPFCTPIMQ